MLKRKLLYLFVFVMFASCSSDDNSTDNPPNIDDTPVAVDDTLTVEEDSVSGTANQVTVSANDDLGDDGGGSDNYSLLSNASNGTVTEVSDGVFEYIPNADFNGTDSFTYEISDKDGDKDSATVSITVNDVPDGPTAEDFNNIDPNFPSFVSIDDTTPDGKKWIKYESMSDEFDAWDGSKWFKSTWHYGVPVWMSTSNANSGVADGKLWIKPTVNESNPEGRWFQTSRIHSRAKTKYPMYTEASIKTCHISAYNTYWLNNGDSKNRDEIDIIENNSNPSCTNCDATAFPTQMNSQYFQADENEEPQTIRNYGRFPRSGLSDTNPLKNIGWNEDYHVYGCLWIDSKNVQFYLDGEPAGSVVVGEHLDNNSYDREFTRELEIIFDVWTNSAGWLGGLPNKSDLEDDSNNTMRIDWVRTWKLEDE
ncbi:Ig-like domain-containing protein [uncultured Algibacter sp.]|uniref:Ig-like domain-containing protein n=1 Tax=uncultured Algibacter sp. TaxID=298659 RepID=UPI00262E5EAE|nr:Ig-like domain-containing protein [uncultured Algibacter sp.]